MFILSVARDLAKRLVGGHKEPLIPISRGPFDILAYIFEICGEEDYRTTLKIAVVSRHWREIVLTTPRAWAFLDFGTHLHDEVGMLYIQRSGRCPLHIDLPHHRSFSLLKNDAARIECLSMYGTPGGGYKQAIFPNVTRLTIHDITAHIPVSLINPTRFPALRHFQCETGWILGSEPISLPPLESLSLVFSRGTGWDSLHACKTTITSLRLHLVNPYSITPRPCITLSKLQCLEIRYCQKGADMWPLDLTTPVLTTYMESEQQTSSRRSFHLNLETVVYMRTDRVPSLRLLPKLRQLQHTGLPVSPVILDKLEENILLCPELEVIFLVMEGGTWTRTLEHQVAEMNKVRAKPICLRSVPQDSDLPGTIPRSCGYGSHLKNSIL